MDFLNLSAYFFVEFSGRKCFFWMGIEIRALTMKYLMIDLSPEIRVTIIVL